MNLAKDTFNRDLGTKFHTCRLCGASGLFNSYLVREMMQNPREEFEYFICPQCGCLQIATIPENLGLYYGSDYFSFQEEPMEHPFQSPVTKTEKILDVGCGSGAWLIELANSGFGNLYGCDPFLEQDLIYRDRISIYKRSIHEMDGNGSFDFIRMHDSFDHMSDPLEVLSSAKKLLKAEGKLAVTIPTYPNIAFKLFGTHWYQLDAPRHIFLHSENSIRLLASQVGLDILDIEYDSNNSQILRSFFYQHGVPFFDITDELVQQYFSYNDILEIDRLCEECNRNHYGDHMAIIFRKQAF